MHSTDSGPLDVSKIDVGPVKSVEDLDCAICRDLYVYWNNLSAAGRLDTFDLIEVPEAIPYLVVLDLEDDTPTFRFRMSGQAIVAASDIDLTGELLDKTGQEAPLTLKFCAAVVAAGTPVFTADGFVVKSSDWAIRFGGSLALPVLDDDGDVISVLLVHCPES